MAFDEATEERAAAFRAKKRQNSAIPWLIRTDGMIFPNVPLIAKKPNFRPYRGDPGAPLEERLAYVQGLPGRRRVVVDAAEPEPFNITKATKDELVQFAMDEYSEPIDPEAHINKVRAVVCTLAGLDYNEVFGAGRRVASTNDAAAAGLHPPG